MAACSECGTTLPRSAKACPECGTRVPPRAPRKAAKPAAKKAAPAKKVAKPAAKATKLAKAAATPAKAAARARTAEPDEAPAYQASPFEPPRGVPRLASPPYERVPTPPSRWPAAEVIGDADERHPDDPVVPLPPPRPGVLDDLAGSAERPSLPLRIARGDWRASAIAALPAVLAVVLASAAAVASIVTASDPDSGDPLFDGTGRGRWPRYVAVGVGMAFGSPVTGRATTGEDAGKTTMLFVPLTVALAGLVVLWVLVRRTTAGSGDRVADAARTAAVFAAGVAAVAAFGRWSIDGPDVTTFIFDSDDPVRTTFTVSAPKVLMWAFLAAFGVALLAHRAPRPAHPWGDWVLAARGAVVGLATGIALSFVVMLALGYAYASRVDATPGDVTRALPALAGYAVNAGTLAFGVAAGGSVTVPTAGDPSGSLFSDYVPDAYLLTMVVPLVAVLVASWYVTRSAGRTPAEAAAACARMAVPAALLWLVVAAVSGIRQTFGLVVVTGAFNVGAVLWTALPVGLWFGAGGWLAGRLLGRRQTAPAFDPPESAPVP